MTAREFEQNVILPLPFPSVADLGDFVLDKTEKPLQRLRLAENPQYQLPFDDLSIISRTLGGEELKVIRSIQDEIMEIDKKNPMVFIGNCIKYNLKDGAVYSKIFFDNLSFLKNKTDEFLSTGVLEKENFLVFLSEKTADFKRVEGAGETGKITIKTEDDFPVYITILDYVGSTEGIDILAKNLGIIEDNQTFDLTKSKLSPSKKKERGALICHVTDFESKKLPMADKIKIDFQIKTGFTETISHVILSVKMNIQTLDEIFFLTGEAAAASADLIETQDKFLTL